MKNNTRFYANTINELLEESVEANTILFIESYEEETYGDCESILNELLSMEAFNSWKIKWTVPNADYIDKCKIIADNRHRVDYVVKNSIGYLEAMEKSSVIFTGEYLSYYYIKREQQTVIGVFPHSYYKKESYISRSRTMFQQTLCKLDYVYCDSSYKKNRLDENSSYVKPFTIIEGNPLRLLLKQICDANVVISLSQRTLGATYPEMETKVKQIKYISVDEGMSFYFRIPNAKWKLYSHENEPEVLNYVGSDINPICEIAQKAKMIITDKQSDVLEAYVMGVPCIFITKELDLEGYSVPKESWIRAENWNEAIHFLSQYIKEGVLKEQKQELRKDLFCDNIKEIVNMACSQDSMKKFNEEQHQSEMIVLPSSISEYVIKALNYYKPDSNVTILMRSSQKERLWKRNLSLSVEKRMFCKIGACAKDELEQHTEHILHREWERLLGRQTFDTIYEFGKEDELWEKLYNNAPANKVVTMEEKDLLELMLQGLNNPSIDLIKQKNVSMDCVSVDTEEYYAVGEVDNTKYLLKRKDNIKDCTLCFIKRKSDISYYLNLLSSGCVEAGGIYIFFDPNELLKGNKVLQNSNVYWIPTDLFPVKILSVTKKVILPEMSELVTILSHLGKDVELICSDEKKVRLNRNIGLLTITSDEDVISILL